MAKLEKIGYGQIEPNRLSAQKTKQIFAQLPLADEVKVCENGMVLVYDEVAGVSRLPKAEDDAAVIGVVMNEIILEDSKLVEDREYAMFNHAETPYQVAINLTPRIFGLIVGDTFTTNVIGETTLPAVGTLMAPNVEGYWQTAAEGVTAARPVAKIVKATTMPDGQIAAKLAIVKE